MAKDRRSKGGNEDVTPIEPPGGWSNNSDNSDGSQHSSSEPSPFRGDMRNYVNPLDDFSATPINAFATFERVRARKPFVDKYVESDADAPPLQLTDEELLNSIPNVDDERVYQTALKLRAKSLAQFRKRLGL